MNTLTGQISNIEVNGSLALVTTKVNGIPFTAIVIETPDTVAYLKTGNTIKILFKETEVIIATGDLPNISLQNRITGTIIQLEKGALLSKLTIGTTVGNVVSVITTKAVEQLKISTNTAVTAMIKTNEILLSE